MGRRHFTSIAHEGCSNNYVSRKKLVEITSAYQKIEFLHDEANAIQHQEKSNLRETKFIRGFYRKPVSLHQQNREIQEETKREREKLRQERKQELHKAVINPITGEGLNDNHRATLRVHPDKLLHDAQRPHNTKRNIKREELISNDGVSNKDYSVKAFFHSYDSYGPIAKQNTINDKI
jgi:hypothetical protein